MSKKEKRLVDLTLSELVDQSLAKGLVPIFEFLDKDEIVDRSAPENKSNDSFQWTDELVKDFANLNFGGLVHRAEITDMIKEFKEERTPKPQAENKQYQRMYFSGEEYILGKPIFGKPAFLRSNEGNCQQRVVSALNSTDHWMCDPIGLVASSDKSLGLPSLEEYAQQEREKLSGLPKHSNLVDAKPAGNHFGFDKPDWEIVKYEFLPLSKKDSPFWIESNSTHWEDAKTNKDYKIFEVKRSDGEVFSVGDKVVNRLATNLPHEGYAITHFTIIQERMQVSVRGGYFRIDDIEKAEKYSEPQPQKEEQRIEVADYEFDVKERWFKISFNQWITYSPEKIKAIKQAIEQVLNEPQVTKADMDKWIDEFNKQPLQHYPLYTQQQVDAMCEDFWYAARAKSRANALRLEVSKYEDLEHYKKSKQ